MSTNKPRVTVFSLGGTIASTNSVVPGAHGVSPELNADDLVAAIPELAEIAEVDAVSFRQIPSADLELVDIIELATQITECFRSGIDGVVVTQGTDTIEEVSFALDLLLGPSKPVVVTGAMRNPTLAGPDGPANLLAAVQVAISPGSSDLGTVVVFNDEIHSARFVRKTHTSNTATFQSPSAGPVGWIIEGRPRIVFRAPPLADTPLILGAGVPSVALLTCALGDNLRLLASIEQLGYAGLVIEGFGGGHVSAGAASAVGDLAARMPVVLTSRTGSGEVLRSTYGFAGSERDLLARGVIGAGFLDGPKSRILLSFLMSADSRMENVRDRFDRVTASATNDRYESHSP